MTVHVMARRCNDGHDASCPQLVWSEMDSMPKARCNRTQIRFHTYLFELYMLKDILIGRVTS